jgi:serine/threonine protein kinase/Tol biopolymer transport system component
VSSPSQPPAPGLRTGQRIAGRYVVTRHLGSGGMGDVYEVEHTLLGKRFALKRLNVDPDAKNAAVERFLREARAAAATGHPGVVEVLDVDFAEDGLPYLVMERLEGETLRHRLDRASLDEPTLLRLAHLVLDALDAVHDASIVHRDIKPENLFLCSDGGVKILDFGLSHDIHVDVRLTQSGAVMGTPMYMAPEQARGEAVDRRTDLYALSAVLYECAAGRPPFFAPAYSVLVALILEAQPDVDPLGFLAERVRQTILAGLSKRPADRPPSAAAMRELLGPAPPGEGWGDIPEPTVRDVVTAPTLPSGDELEKLTAAMRKPRPKPEAQEVPENRQPATGNRQPATGNPRRRRWLAAAALVAAAAFVLAFSFAWRLRSRSAGKPAAPPAAIEVTSSRRLTLDPACEEYPRFLPDGETIVFDGVIDADYEVHRMAIDGTAVERLTRSSGWDYAAAVSPDGARVAFVHEGAEGRTLRVLALGDDAAPRDLGPTTGYPAWTRDGALLVGDASGRIVRWDLTASPATEIARETVLGQLPAGARLYHLAHVEGSGIAVLWWTSTEADATGLGELDADGTLRVIEQSATDYEGGLAPAPSGGGYYVTRRGATTGNQLFWRKWGGDAEVVPGGLSPRAGVDVSRDGRRMVFSTCAETSYIARLRTGAAPEVVSRGEWQDTLPFPIDAQRVLVTSDRRGRQQGWLVAAGAEARPVTPPNSHGSTPSRDGAWVAFAADGGRGGLAIVATGGGEPTSLTRDGSDSSPAWSGDGRQVVFVRTAAGRPPHLHSVAIAGGATRALVAGSQPAVSPVGDTIAFVAPADQTGAHQIMLTDLSGAPPRAIPGLVAAAWQRPRFSPDGTRLLAVRGYREVVEITVDGSVPPRVIWTATTESVFVADWAPDGDGVIASLGDYTGDIWLAEGTFR